MASPVPAQPVQAVQDRPEEDNKEAVTTTTTTPVTPSAPQPTPKSASFWLVLSCLCLVMFVSSLDGSIIAVALPEISRELASRGSDYVGIAYSFLLAQTVVQPATAQLCDVFGRRYPMLIAVCIFALGSGVAGGAKSTAALIAGRTVQGAGSGGITLMTELIICDLLPQRERGQYLGIVLSTGAAGAIVGPVVGGALAAHNWRWCFYLNLPICAVVLPIMAFALRIRQPAISWSHAIKRVDWLGSAVSIASVTALLVGLAFGGTVFAWSSWRVIVPIVLGIVGWAAFHVYETSAWCAYPCVPPRVFAHRTTSANLYMNFVTSMLMQWVSFFWPIYFLAVRNASFAQTGVNFLPYMFFIIPGSAVTGIILSKTGQYRPLHLAGFVLSTLAPGLNTLLNSHTHTAVWTVFQILDALGRACILASTLPAALAPLPESDVAATTGVYSFLRSFGYVWGITIPGIIFNNRFDQLAGNAISDPAVVMALRGGRAYQLSSSTGQFISSLPLTTQRQVVDVYLGALKAVWLGAVGFGASGFIAVAVEKHVALRTDLETEFGLEEKDRTDKSGEQPMNNTP